MNDKDDREKRSEPQGPKVLQFPDTLKRKRPGRRLLSRLLQDPLVVDPVQGGPIVYQHSVLCQTCLPYRDPGATRTWERTNGHVSLLVSAGQAFSPDTRKFVEIGLPFGPKPRLVLYHLNAEALRTQKPRIELEDSLTAFVNRTLGLDTNGRNLRTVKDQLTRLSASDFRIGTMTGEGRAVTLKGSVIDGFDLWGGRDPNQRTLWPSSVHFSERYFESLMKHAVPLDETAVARLAHNAMALDIYTWLAQRLHRIEDGKNAFVPWASLHEQFGHGYERIRDFRRVYLRTLRSVKVVYPEAKFECTDEGMKLAHSRPPIAPRMVIT